MSPGHHTCAPPHATHPPVPPTPSDNQLTGTLPPGMGASGSALQWLDATGNALSGPIPAEWSQGELYRVFLSDNRDLKGCIPRQLWEATRGLIDCAGTRLTCKPCA
jgi:hypothetical protein